MKEQHQPKFTYMRLPPTKWSFETPRIQNWIYQKVVEVCNPVKTPVLNLFAGKTLLKELWEFRIDIVAEFEDKGVFHKTHAQWIGEAIDFVKGFGELVASGKTAPFKVALLDPPYNVRKSREKYGERWIGSFTRIKNELVNILTDSNRIITWGYSSVGMSASRGYQLTEVLLICHSGDHNDTIVTVEDKIIDGEL